MAFFNFLTTKKTVESVSAPEIDLENHSKTIESFSGPTYIVDEYFDGEKTPGELGSLRNSMPNHEALRYRSHSAQLRSDIVKIITGKFFKWVIGTGLKLQSEPSIDALLTENVNFEDAAKFRKDVEARFKVYAESKYSSYNQMGNLHDKAADAFETAFLSGDVLCILRVDDFFNINIEVIDGEHIKTPIFEEDDFLEKAKTKGNRIVNGVEIDNTGKHVAYYVITESSDSIAGKFEKVDAVGENSGKTMAWMMYGSKHRIDHVRGIPYITQILEKVEKLDRYTEAAVGSAEERAKIVFSIEHNKESDGENPLLSKVRNASGLGHNAAEETTGYALGEKTAKTVAATTGKDTINMPVGSQLKSLDSDNEMNYGPFSKAVFTFICASVDIPPEVALQLYEQNYSSSRAAINSWDYIVKIYRKKFSKQFYQNFYNLWLEIEIIKGKINAPEFIKSMKTGNFMVTESYLKARFTGANMPHIDPLKEVKAVRAMLGESKDPLISREQGAEMLGVGDYSKNNEQYIEEDKNIPKEPLKKVEDGNKKN